MAKKSSAVNPSLILKASLRRVVLSKTVAIFQSVGKDVQNEVATDASRSPYESGGRIAPHNK